MNKAFCSVLVLLSVLSPICTAFTVTAPQLLRTIMPPHLETTAERRRRHYATYRSISSTLTEASVDSAKESAVPSVDMKERGLQMNERASTGAPLTDGELDDVLASLKNVAPKENSDGIVWDDLRAFLQKAAHLSHKKDWKATGKNANELGNILFPAGINSKAAQQMLERILDEGCWDKAAAHAAQKPATEKPWAVLVTGVNGIRKTTSLHQPWFADLLQEALVAPSSETRDATSRSPPPSSPPRKEYLPTGENSFFRQLDHMIATLCNEDFARLYAWAKQLLEEQQQQQQEGGGGNGEPTAETVKLYSDYKAAVFSRYRTLSELLGIWLVRQADKSNVLLETSGRDVGMFHYVDKFFPDHNKLVLRFEVNDLTEAKQSVDRRMVHEIKQGIKAVNREDVFEIVRANEGGPYGSDVLEGVQKDSDRVWKEHVGKDVCEDWYKATIHITAHPTEPWTARAVRPDGTLGEVHSFERSKRKLSDMEQAAAKIS
jgi:hypothetical protein